MARAGASRMLIRRIVSVPAAWTAMALIALLALLPVSAPLFRALFPGSPHPLYARASFVELFLAHCLLVGASSFIAAVIGLGAAIIVTRDRGRNFLALTRALAAIGQTFPPVAVLALSVPLIGYGLAPTLVALVLYGILPILEGALAGFMAVPAGVRDAAIGIGFSPWRLLTRIDLPLAFPFIVTGLRTSVVINIGTATVGASIGALSLGSPIIEGLAAANVAYVVQGAAVVALLAILVDQVFGLVAARFSPH